MLTQRRCSPLGDPLQLLRIEVVKNTGELAEQATRLNVDIWPLAQPAVLCRGTGPSLEDGSPETVFNFASVDLPVLCPPIATLGSSIEQQRRIGDGSQIRDLLDEVSVIRVVHERDRLEIVMFLERGKGIIALLRLLVQRPP